MLDQVLNPIDVLIELLSLIPEDGCSVLTWNPLAPEPWLVARRLVLINDAAVFGLASPAFTTDEVGSIGTNWQAGGQSHWIAQ